MTPEQISVLEHLYSETVEGDDLSSLGSIPPGKRTLTMSLPRARPNVNVERHAPVQRKVDPRVRRAVMQRAALNDQWMNLAVRPDIHDVPPGPEDTQPGRERDDATTAATAAPAATATGSGTPMPRNVQTKMEGAFGTDFSNVRVHEGSQATEMGALAFTQGTDIHFAPGEYQPGSQRGQELLGHELTHVVQQSEGRVSQTRQTKGVGLNDDSALEREADIMGAKAARGEPVGRSHTTSHAICSVVQRQEAKSGGGSANERAEAIKDAFHGSYLSEDEEKALDQIRGQSPAMITSIRRAYGIVKGRNLEQSFKRYCNERQATEALGLLWSSMSLLDKLNTCIDEGFLWNSENEAGMLGILRAASVRELQRARSNPKIQALFAQSFNDDEMFEAQLIMAVGKHANAVRVHAVIQRIKASEGWLNDDESAVWDALLELTPDERRVLWTQRQDLFSFLSTDAEKKSLKRICTGTQAAALQERMRLATDGLGTDDGGVAKVAEKTGQSVNREQKLQSILKAGQEQQTPLTPERRAQLQNELAQLGGIQANLLTPERGLFGLKDDTFLGMLEGDVGDTQLHRYMQTMHIQPYELAKQQILDAVSILGSDHDKIHQAFQNLPPALRAKLRADSQVAMTLHFYLSSDARDKVDIFASDDEGAIAIENIRNAYDRIDTDEVAVIKLVAQLSPKHRQQFAQDPLWEEIRTSDAFDDQERKLLETTMTTGKLPDDQALDYALGDLVTTTDPHTGQEYDHAVGGAGMEMMEVYIGALSPDKRASYRMGYWLARSGRKPTSEQLSAALDAFMALEQRMTARLGGDELQTAMDKLLGPPTPQDLQTPMGRNLAAAIMAERIKDKQGTQGSLGDAFTETDETVDIASAQFMGLYQTLISKGDISAADLLQLGHLANEHDARYGEYVAAVDAVTNIAGTVAAVAAGIVVMALSGGTATPLVGTALAKWGVAAAVVGATAKVGVSELVGGQHYDATGREGGLDALTGAIDAAMAVIAANLAARFMQFTNLERATLSAKLTAESVSVGQNALKHVGQRALGGIAEGAIDGLISGVIGEVVLTLADKRTWDKGIWDALCDICAAALKGGLLGGTTGAVMNGAMEMAGGALQVRGGQRILSQISGHVSEGTIGRLGYKQFEALKQLRTAIKRGDDAAEATAMDSLSGFLSKAEKTKVRDALALAVTNKSDLTQVAANMKVTLDGFLQQMSGGKKLSEQLDVSLEVLEPDEFVERFASKQGRAVVILDNNKVTVVVRSDAEAKHLIDEASHLAQLQDPNMAPSMRLLDEVNLRDWDAMSAANRLDLYQRKLEVEIDAQKRALAMLEGDPGSTANDLDSIKSSLEGLERRQADVAAITPEQLDQINAGALPMPEYLDQPPRLFGKQKSVSPDAVTHENVTPDMKRTTVTDSSALNNGAVEVRRIGNEWTESTWITSRAAGQVSAITKQTDGSVLITIEIPNGKPHTYTANANSKLNVEIQGQVQAGDVLAETSRTYRMVEVVAEEGAAPVRRGEILAKDGERWIQRGSESTRRGAIMEDAAKKQLDVELQTKVADGAISDFARIPHRRGGGGFDDVVVEFSGSGDSLVAQIRIIEVKDYPNRTVPLAEFTAIRGSGLKDNLQVLHTSVNKAKKLLSVGDSADGFDGLTLRQLEAIETALNSKTQVRIEIMLGPTTKLGSEGHHASTVLPTLRKEIEAQDYAFASHADDNHIDPSFVDDSTPQSNSSGQ